MTNCIRSRLPKANLVQRLKFYLLLAALACTPLLASEPAELRFAAFPYHPALKLEGIFTPITVSFAHALDENVVFRTPSDFTSFSRAIQSESYDIVFLQPFFYADEADRYNYLPLAKIEHQLRAFVLVDERSPVTSLSDLVAKTIAIPSPLAAVSYLARAKFDAMSIDPYNDVVWKYAHSHTGCYQDLLICRAAACISSKRALLSAPPALRKRLRVLEETDGIPHVLFAAHRRLGEERLNKLRADIISWSDTDAGRRILDTISPSRFIPAEDSDYDSVRTLKRRYGTSLSR